MPCQGWMNEFIIGNLISLLVSMVCTSSEVLKIQNKTWSNTGILIGLMNNELCLYHIWNAEHQDIPWEKKELFLAHKLFQADYASLPSFRFGISILFIMPIKIRILDQLLFWIFCSSLEERTIETKWNQISDHELIHSPLAGTLELLLWL